MNGKYASSIRCIWKSGRISKCGSTEAWVLQVAWYICTRLAYLKTGTGCNKHPVLQLWTRVRIEGCFTNLCFSRELFRTNACLRAASLDRKQTVSRNFAVFVSISGSAI